jgi:hypothetical protein
VQQHGLGKETAAHQQPPVERAGVQKLRPEEFDVGTVGLQGGIHIVEAALQVVVHESLHHIDQPLGLQKHALLAGGCPTLEQIRLPAWRVLHLMVENLAGKA